MFGQAQGRRQEESRGREDSGLGLLLVNRYQREMLDSFPSCNTRKSGVTLLITKGFYTGKAQTMPLVSVTVIIPEWQFNDGEEKSHICFSSEPIRSIQQKPGQPRTHCSHSPLTSTELSGRAPRLACTAHTRAAPVWKLKLSPQGFQKPLITFSVVDVLGLLLLR